MTGPLRVIHRYQWPAGLAEAVRSCFAYGPGEDRATGYLYAEGELGWPAALAVSGPRIVADAGSLTGERFTHVAFQAYRDGAGCAWHADTPFAAQAILSLGVTRTFAVRPAGGSEERYQVAHGDLVFMPPGMQDEWEHCVPVEDVPGERYSLVMRTVRR